MKGTIDRELDKATRARSKEIAQLATLRAENERLRAIVRPLAESYIHYERGAQLEHQYCCHYCFGEGQSRSTVHHYDHCIVGTARAALEGEE